MIPEEIAVIRDFLVDAWGIGPTVAIRMARDIEASLIQPRIDEAIQAEIAHQQLEF